MFNRFVIGKNINHATHSTSESTMPFPTSDPIVLEIKPRSKDDIRHILSTFGIITQTETKTTQLAIGVEEMVSSN